MPIPSLYWLIFEFGFCLSLLLNDHIFFQESETTLLRFLSLELESRHRRKAKSASKRSAKGGKVGRRARQKLAKSPSTTESVKEESELPPSHEPPVNPPKSR